MADAETYYVRRRGRIEGPWPLARIRSEIALKQLAAFHEISTDGVSWTQARELAELFPRDGRRKSRAQEPVMELSTGLEGWDLELDQAVPLTADDADEWHYSIDQQQQGPFTRQQLVDGVLAGRLPLEGFTWHAKFGEQWRPVEQVPELMQLIDRPWSHGTAGAASSHHTHHGDYSPQGAPQALYALITGIITLLFSPIPLAGFMGIVPFALGAFAIHRINGSQGRLVGTGKAVTGLLLGMASMAIALVVLLGLAVWLQAQEEL